MKKTTMGYYVIASAIIWGAVIVGCALKLRGTECYQSIDMILFAGMFTHLILIWGPLAALFVKKDKKKKNRFK
jgi:hypothetical protein